MQEGYIQSYTQSMLFVVFVHCTWNRIKIIGPDQIYDNRGVLIFQVHQPAMLSQPSLKNPMYGTDKI